MVGCPQVLYCMHQGTSNPGQVISQQRDNTGRTQIVRAGMMRMPLTGTGIGLMDGQDAC